MRDIESAAPSAGLLALTDAGLSPIRAAGHTVGTDNEAPAGLGLVLTARFEFADASTITRATSGPG